MCDNEDCLAEGPVGELEEAARKWNHRADPELTPQEKAELCRLYAEHLERHKQDGGVWPEFTGDGK